MHAAQSDAIAAAAKAVRDPAAETSKPPLNADTENATCAAPSCAANTRLRTSSGARRWMSVIAATSPSPRPPPASAMPASATETAGAALTSYMKKCESDAAATCEKKAVSKDGKPLAGAAKSSFVKKCVTETAG